MRTYGVTLLLTLCACFGMQQWGLRAVGGRTTKSESNYFSSLGRIQAGARDEPGIMLLGSSITGRLPDRANGFDGVANMGCDGGSAVDVLRALDEGVFPAAPHLVIEANTLHLASVEGDSEIGKAMRTPWFRAGLIVPAVSSYARPSAFLYSRLLAGKIGGFSPGEGSPDLGVETMPAEVGIGKRETSPAEDRLIEEVVGILERLNERGTEATIIWLPPKRRGADPPGWILELAARAGVRYWDLGQEARPGTVTLTDAVHMSAPSAARTMNSILPALD